MKKGFVAMILALVAVMAFSGRAFAFGIDPSDVTKSIQEQIDAAADAISKLKDSGLHKGVGDFDVVIPVFPKQTILFSTEVSDYSVAMYNEGNAVLYGKLMAGVEESDLSTFGAVGKANLKNATLKAKFDDIKEKSMLMWYSWEDAKSHVLISTPVVTSKCEVLSDKVHFRCSGFFGGQPLDGFYTVRAALLAGAPSIKMDILSMLTTAEAGDADADGVPDAIDGCATADSFADPLAECETPDTPVDTDADGVADVDDPCPSDPTDACLQPEDSDGDGVADVDDACPSDPEDACVNANAGAGDTTPVGPVADDGGSCSLNPAAGGNPIAFLVIAFGLLPLAWRRKV